MSTIYQIWINKKCKGIFKSSTKIIIIPNKRCTSIYDFDYLFGNKFFKNVQSKFEIYFNKNIRSKQSK